jgi:hypothetical protein
MTTHIVTHTPYKIRMGGLPARSLSRFPCLDRLTQQQTNTNNGGNLVQTNKRIERAPCKTRIIATLTAATTPCCGVFTVGQMQTYIMLTKMSTVEELQKGCAGADVPRRAQATDDARPAASHSRHDGVPGAQEQDGARRVAGAL